MSGTPFLPSYSLSPFFGTTAAYGWSLTIHGAKTLFDTSCHPHQTLVIPILEKIHKFFIKSPDNSIAIWHCPSSYKWKPHKDINKEVKLLRITPTLPSKESWDFSRKSKCEDLLNYWKMSFQASDKKECNFLDLDGDDKGNPIELYYKKEEHGSNTLATPTPNVPE